MFAAAGNIMTKKRVRLSYNHLEELMYLHEVWQKVTVREWMTIKKARLVYWLHVVHMRAHTHKHTHSYTKNPLGRVPCFFVVTNNKYQKRIAFISETLSPCCTNICTPPHDRVCIIIHPHQHRRMSGFLPFCPLNRILSCREPIFF